MRRLACPIIAMTLILAGCSAPNGNAGTSSSSQSATLSTAAQNQANVNSTEVPYNRRPGAIPALGDADIEDVIAFLNTLTDGYQN